MARFKVSWKKQVSIGRVVGKLVATLIALYVGGTVINSIGLVLNKTESPMYGGFGLIGWTVGYNPLNATGTGYHLTCAGTTTSGFSATPIGTNCVTNVSGSTTSVLTVIGLIGIATIMLEFVQFKLH